MIRRFMLAAEVVGDGIWEFMNNADGPAFLVGMQKLGGLQKWMVGGIFRKLRVAGSEERMWKPSWRIRLSFRRSG